MNFRYLVFVLIILPIVSFAQSNNNDKPINVLKAYIQRPGLDSISKADLLKDNTIHFSKDGIKITQAEAYFYQGSFKNVQMQTFTGNKLDFLNVTWISNASTPYRITIDSIHYIDKDGNKGIAEGFSFIVY